MRVAALVSIDVNSFNGQEIEREIENKTDKRRNEVKSFESCTVRISDSRTNAVFISHVFTYLDAGGFSVIAE
jgi:hypothetical protein